jgi:hypothetical protein
MRDWDMEAEVQIESYLIRSIVLVIVVIVCIGILN